MFKAATAGLALAGGVQQPGVTPIGARRPGDDSTDGSPGSAAAIKRGRGAIGERGGGHASEQRWHQDQPQPIWAPQTELNFAQDLSTQPEHNLTDRQALDHHAKRAGSRNPSTERPAPAPSSSNKRPQGRQSPSNKGQSGSESEHKPRQEKGQPRPGRPSSSTATGATKTGSAPPARAARRLLDTASKGARDPAAGELRERPRRASPRPANQKAMAPSAAPSQGGTADPQEHALLAKSNGIECRKLYAALESKGVSNATSDAIQLIKAVNGLSISDINGALSGPEAFRVLYEIESPKEGQPSTAARRDLTIYSNFEQLAGNRPLSKGIQNYVKWAAGLTENKLLQQSEQKANLDAITSTLTARVCVTLNPKKVSAADLSGRVEGVLMDPVIWKYASSESLVKLEGTFSGTKGVGAALNARKDSLQQLQYLFINEKATLSFIQRFDLKALSYQDPNLLNGWYPANKQPPNGAEMHRIMASLNPAAMVDGDRKRADTPFIRNAVKLQLKERPPAGLVGLAGVLWKYANNDAALISKGRRSGPGDHSVQWFFRNFVTPDTQANLGKAMRLWAAQTGSDWTKLPTAVTKPNDGLSISTALAAASGSAPAPRTPQSHQGVPNIPTLTKKQRNDLDYFELGAIERCKKRPGYLTFEKARDGRCFSPDDLPELIESFQYLRLTEEFRPVKQSINAPFAYGGNVQDFSLGIAAFGVGANIPCRGWFANVLSNSAVLPAVVGWDYFNLRWRPAFWSFRWTPGAAEVSFGKPRRDQVSGITVNPEDYERVKRACTLRAEIHADAAYDFQRKTFQFFLRGEGNTKSTAIGLMWQVAKAFLFCRGRRFGRGRSDGAPSGGEPAGASGASGGGARGGGVSGTGAGGGAGDGEADPATAAAEKEDTYKGVVGVVRRFLDQRKNAALDKGRKLVNGIAAQLDQHVEEMSRDPVVRRRAERAGITIKFGTGGGGGGGPGVGPGPGPRGPEGEVTSTSTPGSAPGGRRGRSFRLTIEATKRGGVGEEGWETDPDAADILSTIGIPQNFTMLLKRIIPEETAEEIKKLPRAEKFWVHILKATEAALFFNFNFTPGVAYAGFYLDIGFVLPIVVTMFPPGKGGATAESLLSAGAVFPLWVRGKSIQIYGNRSEKVATAGIVVR